MSTAGVYFSWLLLDFFPLKKMLLWYNGHQAVSGRLWVSLITLPYISRGTAFFFGVNFAVSALRTAQNGHFLV